MLIQLQPTPPAVPDPQTAELVAQTIYGAMIFGAIALIWLYLSQPDQDGGVSRWRRWCAAAEDWLASGVSLRRYLAGERGVNDSMSVMSSDLPQTEPDQQTDEPDRRADGALSGDPRLCSALQLDKTKVGLITVLVYNEWTVSEIRSLLKGDNTTMSQEIADVRKSLGLAPPVEYRTPIAGRPSQAEFEPPPVRSAFRESDPELAYQPPD